MYSRKMRFLAVVLTVVLATTAFGASMAFASTVGVERSQAAQAGSALICVSDDARVQEANPTTNYGSGVILAVDTPPPSPGLVYTFLKFNVTVPAGMSVQSAVLKLNVRTTGTNGTNYPVNVHSVSNTTWTEGTLNWNNRPALGGVVASLPAPLGVGASVTSSTIAGGVFGGSGLYSFGLAYPSSDSHSDGIDFSSKEDGGSGPCLEVTFTTGVVPPPPGDGNGVTPPPGDGDGGGVPGPVVPSAIPGPDLIPLPEWAVVGSILNWTPIYYAPDPLAASSVELSPGTTLWILGMHESRAFYLGAFAGSKFWLPVRVVGPNYDEVWQGRPLPTEIVEG